MMADVQHPKSVEADEDRGELDAQPEARAQTKREDQLASAYWARTAELHDARRALAEAVSSLTVELRDRREQLAAARGEAEALRRERDRAVVDSDALRQRAEMVTAERDFLRQHTAALEAELRAAHDQTEVLRNMKVVRWTVWPRRIWYRLRPRGQ